ncbi:MAG: PEGA domain-containing protein [Chloroflexota bacterium]
MRFKWIRAALPAVCGIGIAAVVGWLLAGGIMPSADVLFGQPEPAAVESLPAGAPVHIDSTPSGAQVHIDGMRYGSAKTPLNVRLASGQHSLSLEHPDTLEDERVLHVAETGASVDVALWRRRTDVVPLRPVYPGAALVDARFLDNGQVALLVSIPARPGAPSASRELWRLDPTTGQLVRVIVPGLDAPVSTMILAPDGEQAAYVRPGSSPAVTASLWPVNGNTSAGTVQRSHSETVWQVPLDGSLPPRRIFELPSASGPGPSSDPERIVDLAWTPDGSRLVVITRQTGQPTRTRIFLSNVPARGDTQLEPDPNELVLLPAEVIPGSAMPDPTGHWLALVTHAAVAPGGSNMLNLCILELKSGGVFRDLADLGSAARAPSAAPVAWSPAADGLPGRLVFVGPAPTPPSSGGGLFDFFGVFSALRASSAPPSGLFMASVEASGLETVQPRRVGTAINILGPAWRSENAVHSFARQDDGSLALRSIDPTSGAVRDLGVRLPTSTGQGTGLAARWDTRHGNALLLARPSNNGTGGASLQAWLVSFVSPSSAAGASH